MGCRTPGRLGAQGRWRRRRILTLLFALAQAVAALPVAAFSQVRARPPDLDLSRVRMSENGHFKIAIKPETDPVPLRRLHSWTIHVEDAAGHPVTAASITVDGGMPEHGHGLPTEPDVTKNLGEGDYLVEGLKFQMKGWWEVRFSITTAGGSDGVVFNLIL